jgi:alpha-tubulin suppressor-like RCC1 family protein
VGDGVVCAPPFTHVALGANSHGCGIGADQSLYCWGDNQYGELGQGGTTPTNTALKIGAAKWLAVQASQLTTCGIQSDHTLWCWGSNSDVLVGQPAATDHVEVPTQVGTATDWQELAVGTAHACARKIDNSLWCWGADTYGGLGNSVGGSNPTPTMVGSAKDWIMIRGGDLTSCGIRADSSLWCWGYSDHGQTGGPGADGYFAVHTPTQVSAAPASGWKDVSVYDHGCGVGKDGTLWCWGGNGRGELGIGSTADQPAPVQVGTDTNWAAVAAGNTHTCARKTDGSLWCWGANTSANLGNASNLDEHAPVQAGFIVGSDAPIQAGYYAIDWTEVSAGLDTACGVRSDGSAWCWGNGFGGGLGNGSNAPTVDLAMLVRQ